MDITQLEQRLTRLEDIEAIRQLKARYCAVCDDNHNPDAIVTLFVEGGIWEDTGDATRRAQGLSEIRRLFERIGQRVSYSHHMVTNPIIEVSGDRAKGTWYFLGLFTERERNQARWLALQYEDDYVKVGGVWKYEHLRIHRRVSASYEKGWAHPE